MIRGLLTAMVVACVTPGLAGEHVYVFSRPGCAPCEAMHRAFGADPSLLEGREVYKVNTKERPDIAKRFGVSGVPVVVLVRDGREVRRRIGWTNADDFSQWLDDVRFRRAYRVTQ